MAVSYTVPLLSLTWFTFWALLLVLNVGRLRVTQVMAGKAKPDSFPAGIKHGTDAEWRANRAQANTVENLPIFATLVLVGVAAGVATETFATLCLVVAVARPIQSIIHIASGSTNAVNLRFAAFLVQLACFVWMAVILLLHFYGM